MATTTRPQEDPATSATPVSMSSTQAVISSQISNLPSETAIATDPIYSSSSSIVHSLPTTTQPVASIVLSSPSIVGLTPTTTTTDSTSIEWGPAITVVPYPSATATTVAEVGHHTMHHGLTHRAKQITTATTVSGGVLFFVVLLYIFLQRRKGATYSDIVCFRRHRRDTIVLTPSAYDNALTALPIHREWRYSVNSSHHPSLAPTPRLPKKSMLPLDIKRRSQGAGAFVKDAWKNTHPPTAPQTPMRQAHARSFLLDESPPGATITRPEVSHASDIKPSSTFSKSMPNVSVRQTGSSSNMEAFLGSPPMSPDSISSQKHLNRWSWTNSQAPPTPRMRASTFRSSISSLSRLRTIKSWVRNQGPRIDEEGLPVPQLATRRPELKNKASLPKLAPPPLGKNRSR